MKTTRLIKGLTFLTIVLFVFNSCSKDNDEISYDLAGSWKVIYFKDGSKKIQKTPDNTWPDINNGDITANFSEPDSHGKGTVSGIKVTNGYNGNFTISGSGKIYIGPITTTYINEPDWTELFNISAADNFEIKNSKLFIYYNSGNNIIVFERS